MPVAEAATSTGYQRRFSVGEVRGRRSYQDDGCEPGTEYEYRLFAGWTDPATGLERTSAPATARVLVGTVLTPVRRLDIAERVVGDRTVVDLAWDQPSRHDVVVYRTATPPSTGAALADLDVSALPGAGLPDDQRLRAEPHLDAGRAGLSGIAWPQDWPRVHFTAVSISGTAARIGDTATLSRTSRVEDIRIVERVDWQLLTFSWPSGAVSVSVSTTPRGMTLEDYPGEVVAELSEADYRRNGGTRLTLPAEGCDVHLVPKSFFERKQVVAPAETVSYAGLFSLWYLLQPPGPRRSRRGAGVAGPRGRAGRGGADDARGLPARRGPPTRRRAGHRQPRGPERPPPPVPVGAGGPRGRAAHGAPRPGVAVARRGGPAALRRGVCADVRAGRRLRGGHARSGPREPASMNDGRLTYTSVDARGAGSGGWQVMQEHDLTDDERRRALEVVATAIDPAVDLSRFPSQTEIDALPRRLVVATAGGGTLLVHSAPAGPDASGRPGNVFNHVVAVQDLAHDLLATPDVPRPVQLWRSPDWLNPWGADAVRAGALPAEVRPVAGPVVTRQGVARMLSDRATAAGLGALLDAVGARMAGTGRPVVLPVDDQDRGALWIGAVSLLAGPALTARLTFSTWERGYALRAGAELLDLVLVPRIDESQLQGVDAVVLDPDAQLPARDASWPAVHPRETVPVGDWSSLVEGVCGLPEREIDELLFAVAELSTLNPRIGRSLRHSLVPLALAVSEGGLPGSGVAARVLSRVPEELLDDAESRADVQRLLLNHPRSAADQALALTELVGEDWDAGAPPIDGRTRAWLEQLLREPSLVTGPWPPPLPAVEGLLSEAGRRGLAEVLAAALPLLLTVPLGDQDTAVALVRVLDLAGLVGVDDLLPPEVVEPAAALAVQLLHDASSGPDVLARVGPLSPPALELLVPALDERVERSVEPAGRRLPDHVARWAHRVLAEIVPPETPLFLELLLVDPAHPHYWKARAAAAATLLRELARGPDTDRTLATRGALDRIGDGTPWNAAELAYLQRLVGGLPAVDLTSVVRDVLRSAPLGSTDAASLARQVLDGAYGAATRGTALACLAELHEALADGPAGGEDDHLVDLMVAGLGVPADGRVPAGRRRGGSPGPRGRRAPSLPGRCAPPAPGRRPKVPARHPRVRGARAAAAPGGGPAAPGGGTDRRRARRRMAVRGRRPLRAPQRVGPSARRDALARAAVPARPRAAPARRGRPRRLPRHPPGRRWLARPDRAGPAGVQRPGAA